MINFRKASTDDMELYLYWANENSVREYSFNSESIDLQKHVSWFNRKISDPDCLMLVFYNEFAENIGQVRIEKQNNLSAVIGISIDKKYRGKGYSIKALQLASDFYFELFNEMVIEAFIKKTNVFSIHSFEGAGFEFVKELVFQNFETVLYRKKRK
jgi:RimJ/RimL family protein N-acetyltransferase